ncbi:MAG: glycerophosphodiester phosphodiesterase family protein, partial [Myxococcota bacterium]
MSAHRAGPGLRWPENSMSALRGQQAAHGRQIFEMDVHRTVDGHWIVMHDDTVDRTTTGTGHVDALTLPEIRRLRLKDPTGKPTDEAPPLFEDVLAFVRGRGVLAIDLKSPELDEVIDLLRKTDTFGHAFLILYDATEAAGLFSRYPELCLSVPAF